ncbi:hypothetical protein G6F65_023038 [Rhizopus arrhizus]|nr:hypothetical protein G6F65_023038 [Rhizopus arrhizus]
MGQARLGMGAGKGGHHLGGNQRTVHHQAGIALGAGHRNSSTDVGLTVSRHCAWGAGALPASLGGDGCR